jgi:hypothetical protein
MSYFDFSEEVRRAISEAIDLPSRLSAKTTVHRVQFAGAVKRAGFEFLSRSSRFTPGPHDLVVGAAPWSDPDLAALEDLASVAPAGVVRISIFDIDDMPFPEMAEMLPGIRVFTKTPVVLQYRNGELVYFGQGHDAVLWLRQL